MAGDWIKIEHGLSRKPEVLALSQLLDMDRFEVVGRLIEVWCWFDQMTENGNAPSVTEALLDRYICNAGFAQALVSVHWLVVKDDGLCVPHWDRHNSKSAKTRALTKSRVKRKRNASCVTTSSLLSKPSSGDRDAGKGVAVLVPDALATAPFIEAWTKWQKYRRGLKKPKDWNGMFQEQLDHLAGFTPAEATEAIRSSMRNGYTGLFPKKAGKSNAATAAAAARHAGTAEDSYNAQPAVSDDVMKRHAEWLKGQK